MKKIARSLRHHWELILNYFRAQKLISSGVVASLRFIRFTVSDVLGIVQANLKTFIAENNAAVKSEPLAF
jgi:hypothetical protein